jgi:hypothetical protein
MMRSWIAFSGVLFLAAIPVSAQVDPASLPAHDAHQGLLVAADPYTDAKRVEARLGRKNPLEGGLLPIEVYFRNSGGQPIRLNLDAIRLDLRAPGSSRQHLEALPLEDVIDLTLNKGGTPDIEVPTNRLPRRQKAGRSKKWKELEARLTPLLLGSDIVAPGATVHGFLFFNLKHHFDLVRYASLYLPEVKLLATNQPLMFFEVELGPAGPH